MAYTSRQKADYYLEKFNGETFNPTLSKIYWQLYKAFDNADKGLKLLSQYRQVHPIPKKLNYKNLKLV